MEELPCFWEIRDIWRIVEIEISSSQWDSRKYPG